MSRGFRFRRNQIRNRFIVVLILLLLSGAIYGITKLLPNKLIPVTEEEEVIAVVNQFYQLEQKGDFGSSWEMLHSIIKEKFEKQSYIQKKSNVFMEDFDVETFEYAVGDPENLPTWQMSPTSPMLSNVYKVPVTQKYQSLFGLLSIQQDIYLTKENDAWKIVWSYTE